MRNTFITSVLIIGSCNLVMAGDAPFIRPSNWAPYFRDAEGKESNLPSPIEKIESKQWPGLQWTEFQGAKLRLAVMPVENKATQSMPRNLPAALATIYGAQFAQIPVNSIEDLLSVGLQNTNRFRLFERKQLEGVMAEKGLQASTNVAQAQVANSNSGPAVTAADAQKQMMAMAMQMQAANNQSELKAAANAQQAAKLMGAQYTVYASVIEWTPDKSKSNASGGGIGSNRGGLGAIAGMLGVNKSEAEVAMSFRIVDTATGEVKWSLDERATAGNWGFSLMGFGAGSNGAGALGGGMSEKTPINYAVKACINKAIYRIAMTLKDQAWRGALIKAGADGKVYINAGKDAGFRPGMVLVAQSVGEELKDPATGEVLDCETRAAGRIVISDVRERVSTGTAEGIPEGLVLKAGDRVELPASANGSLSQAPVTQTTDRISSSAGTSR